MIRVVVLIILFGAGCIEPPPAIPSTTNNANIVNDTDLDVGKHVGGDTATDSGSDKKF